LHIFEDLFKNYSKDITLKFFTNSKEALGFIDSIENQEKIFFISSCELRNSDFNGLTIILQSRVQRSFILTSTYTTKDLQSMLERLNVQLLLKQFLPDMPVKVI
jgi:hypothetical protein